MITSSRSDDAGRRGIDRLARTVADQAPDRRGEAFAIFTTIFVRPALELGAPLGQRAAAVATGVLAGAAGRWTQRRAGRSDRVRRARRAAATPMTS